MAKGYDIEKYKETLENPHAKAVDRDTAQIMMDRNMKKLQELFGIQQAKNGNSTGEMETQNVRSGQAGLINVNQPRTFGPNAPSVLTPEQQKQYYLNQGMFNNPGYSMSKFKQQLEGEGSKQGLQFPVENTFSETTTTSTPGVPL